VEACVRNMGLYGCTRTTIKQVCGSSQSVGPERSWNVSLEHNGVHSIINGTNGTLGFTVLLGSAWA
jgi:hypothetical protein